MKAFCRIYLKGNDGEIERENKINNKKTQEKVNIFSYMISSKSIPIRLVNGILCQRIILHYNMIHILVDPYRMKNYIIFQLVYTLLVYRLAIISSIRLLL